MNNVTHKLLLNVGLASLLASANTFANDRQQFSDYAKVTQVTPVYKTFEHRIPEEVCYVERVRVETHHRNHDSATGTLVGGLIGGAIGHSVGHGSKNKKIGTVIGTVLGASIGSDVSREQSGRNHKSVRYENIEKCDIEYRTEVEERLLGYDVDYQYRGESYATRMREHPGKQIRVNVSVTPAEY